MTTYDEALDKEIQKLTNKIQELTFKRVRAYEFPILAEICFASDSGKFVGECRCPQCVEMVEIIVTTGELPHYLTK